MILRLPIIRPVDAAFVRAEIDPQTGMFGYWEPVFGDSEWPQQFRPIGAPEVMEVEITSRIAKEKGMAVTTWIRNVIHDHLEKQLLELERAK